mmetsp:Transcript_23956/g.41002  ORF Transcript_23956/g.41002 Transcript_23956/m.41002 type:complete len:266 (+) Transcript_23956:137-934(+)|eukprot:CAMPEP_0183707548 /NCGR_PEP_ID=MMETSP0737-20130205/4100_1 /TAXON_ID=385413 /ORGANISM="Thalassiosira miniscula, Strain CCMP1093" /LENGTH=265 /DNA_ID=CAMNT_0025935247 /DNA_START=156 /DNA_END=953 /DNA_ORIENTATION=-
MKASPECCKLVVLYGIGGLSDVGRHAILAALEKNEPTIDKITVITEYPEKLDEKNWECNCPGGHTNPFEDPKLAMRLEMVKIDTWKNKDQPNLSNHFEGASAVVSCLGHRQPGWKYKELIKKGLIAYDGNKQVIVAMEEAKVDRVVTISSFGINGDKDWPHWAGKLMKLFFRTFMRKSRKDLEKMENAYTASSLDYLFVRPVGIGEEVVPVGEYYLQEPGNKNKEEMVGGNMAKMDVARFMVDEAVHPTLHKCSKTVGSKPGTPM